MLDEPASQLDPLARTRLQDTVARLARSGKVGVLWSTPNLGEVGWCDRVWALREGRLLQANAQDWSPGEEGCVPPWPVEWARRWGRVQPAWRSSHVESPGSLPELPSASSETAMVRVRELVYRPPGAQTDLFSGLNFELRQGECVGLVGANGAGKTTLARLLRGLLQPLSGTVEVDGADLAGRPVPMLAGTVAYTFQEPSNLFVRPRVDAELLYSGELLGLPQEQACQRAELALQRFGLQDWAASHPRELPASAVALLGVALSWYTQARLQILDEPLARLDGPGRQILEKTIADWREQGTTVLLIAHDLDWLATVCGQFLVLEAGRVQAQGPAGLVFTHPSVREKLGCPLPLKR